MMKIHDMTNVKDYSVEYDRIMNTNLELVKGVYGYDKISFSIPEKYTFVKMHVFESDGGYEHPAHNSDFVAQILEMLDVEKDALIDYPRHNNKLRYFFKDYEEAVAALFMVKKYVKEMEVE